MGRCSVDGVAINAHRPAKATHILVPVDDTHDSEEAVLWALTNVWKGAPCCRSHAMLSCCAFSMSKRSSIGVAPLQLNDGCI